MIDIAGESLIFRRAGFSPCLLYTSYGDLVFIVTRPSFISNVFALCGKEQFEIKNIVIVGASRIGIKTASLLEKNYHVKIIEKDREKCIQLADKLKSTLVINGDGRDLTLLREEGIKNVDAFISLTGSSETNISVSYTHLDVYKRQPPTIKELPILKRASPK